MPVALRAPAAAAFPTQVGHQCAHDPVADFEVRDFGSSRDDRSGAFVRGCLGEFGAEDAFGHHAVGVAEGGDGYFDEDVAGGEGGGRRHGDSMDAVGLVDCGGFAVSRGSR